MTALPIAEEKLARAREKLIVALDVDTVEKALELHAVLSSEVGYFKIGFELIYRMLESCVVPAEEDAFKNFLATRRLFDSLHNRIFLDTKFGDIPNTVHAATAAVCGLGVKMFNIHASAGVDPMKRAMEYTSGFSQGGKPAPLVLAVTVLSSFNRHDAELTFGKSLEATLLQMLRDARRARVDGIIASPDGLDFLREHQEEASGLIKVATAIRPEWYLHKGHSRTMTPREAVHAGADYLVVGRPIIRPEGKIKKPLEAARLIVREIAEALRD